MKKIFIIIMLCSSFFSGIVYAKDREISVVVNDKLISREEGQIDMVNGVAYISVKFLEPALNIDMYWMNEIGQVQLNKDEKIMILNLHDNTLTTDWLNVERYMVVSKNNDIMVPMRLVAEYFGYKVSFKSDGPIISITSSEKLQEQDEKATQKEKAHHKVIYLTFDDGPSPYTDKLLELLDKYQVKATFFMLDGAMKKNPESVKHIVERGHAVGLHGVTHKPHTFYCGHDGPLKEMEQTNETLESIVGFRSCLIRTPFGSNPHLTLKQYLNLVSHEYRIWDWNIDSKDWAYNNPHKAFNTTIKNMKTSKKEPKVVLFHDMKYVVETLELFLKWMDENQYTSKEITADLVPVKMTQKK
ncbi:polysaccharide deacetylase family protein [Cellulosilyticum sp. I15G10I2]|uniref:polysaccharide deacetylase family protein n=1 Tax=Cellulosilyticum sp. I15G10I2 TaxID=1892843 RepID=UPI00085BFC45|nr:polysaccharide deacetylase family protein [Cellulosilyticum sp. I15G10I2]